MHFSSDNLNKYLIVPSFEIFFSIGNKVTKGDPKLMADWSYYFMWMIFIAFLSVFLGNILDFINYQKSNTGK